MKTKEEDGTETLKVMLEPDVKVEGLEVKTKRNLEKTNLTAEVVLKANSS